MEVERLTTGEFYMRCVNDIEKRYEEFKNRERIYNSSAVAPYDPRYKMDDFTESENGKFSILFNGQWIFFSHIIS